MKKLRMLSILALIFCLALASLTSCNVFAALPSELRLFQIIQNPYWRSNNGESFHNGTYSFGNNTGTYNAMQYLYLHNNSNGAVNVPAFSFIRLSGVVVMYAQMDGVNAYEYTASPNGYFNLNTGQETSCKGIDLEYDQQDSYAQGSGYVYRYNFNALFYCYDAASTPTLNLQVSNQNTLGAALTRLGINNYSIWQYDDSDPDFSQIISAIDEQTESIDELIALQESTKESTEQQTQIQQQEYDKTIQDESNASSGANGFSFNFSLPNPFEVFRVGDGCVTTPTVDSWLGLVNNSNHCPIFPQTVRNTLTPVVTLFVSLATLMVVIRWVSGTTADISDMRVAQSNAKIAAERSEYYKSKKGGK